MSALSAAPPLFFEPFIDPRAERHHFQFRLSRHRHQFTENLDAGRLGQFGGSRRSSGILPSVGDFTGDALVGLFRGPHRVSAIGELELCHPERGAGLSVYGSHRLYRQLYRARPCRRVPRCSKRPIYLRRASPEAICLDTPFPDRSRLYLQPIGARSLGRIEPRRRDGSIGKETEFQDKCRFPKTLRLTLGTRRTCK